MTTATLFFALSCIGLVFSVMTLFRVRLIPQLTVPTFVIGWLRGELALQTIAVEALVTLGFWRAGAFETGPGGGGFGCGGRKRMQAGRAGPPPRAGCGPAFRYLPHSATGVSLPRFRCAFAFRLTLPLARAVLRPTCR